MKCIISTYIELPKVLPDIAQSATSPFKPVSTILHLYIHLQSLHRRS